MSKSNGAPKQERKRFTGRVLGVSSGDTVTVLELDNVNTRTDEAPALLELTLSSVQTPLLGRQKNPDEDFAWAAREFLRQKLIGKKIFYYVNFRSGTKAYGEIFLRNEDVRLSVVQAGWATVKKKDQQREGTQQFKDIQALTEAEEKAKNEGRGKYSTKKNQIQREVISKFNNVDVFSNLKGKHENAIVEKVITGSTLRLYLTKSKYSLVVQLSGVVSPNYKYNLPEDQQEHYATAAKFFTECCLLNRDVDVVLEGIDKGDNFFGTVLYNDKNIALELLRQGLASYVDWTGSKTEFATAMRDAEAAAKKQQLRLWQHGVHREVSTSQNQAKENKSSNNELIGRVTQIINVGTIEVAEFEGNGLGRRHKVTLSSIIVPRMMNKDELAKEKEEGARTTKEDDQLEAAYAWEAREFLRKKLIGKKVRCVFDYERKQQKGDKKECYTVYQDKSNVALDLTNAGYAKVVKHGRDDLRSAEYEELILAENNAQKQAKGWHGPRGKKAALHLNDLSGADAAKDATKLKAMLPFLQRTGKVTAVVEMVFNATGMKLWIPRESCMISFALQGVRCERVEKTKDGKVNPSAEGSQAYLFSRDQLMQHEVEVEVSALDAKTGRFLGDLFINKKNFAVSLLQEGWAFLNFGVAKNLKNASELRDAEESARNKRKNHWVNYDPVAEEEAREKRRAENAEKRKPQTTPEVINIVVTEILSGSEFYYQTVGEELKALEQVEKALREQLTSEELSEAFDFNKAGVKLCAAQFSADGQWYRAEIKGVADDGEYIVQYVDYGNMESVPAVPSRIRKLDDAFNETVLPRQARLGKLAYLICPDLDDEWGRDAAAALKSLVWGHELVANPQSQEGNVTTLILGEPEGKVHVNAAMVRQGLGRVERRYEPYLQQLIDRLREEEQHARTNHLNMWQYGDIPDQEEEDDYNKKNRRRK
jgi:staphylococcal nuclease domain-containing protein 1